MTLELFSLWKDDIIEEHFFPDGTSQLKCDTFTTTWVMLTERS